MEERFALDFIADSKKFYLGQSNQMLQTKSMDLAERDLTLYHIEEVTFEDKAPRKEALENVISSLQIEGINFVYIILGDKKGVHFYFGISRDINEGNEDRLELPIYDLGRHVLQPSLRGNFRGSKINEVSPTQKRYVMEKIREMDNYCYLEGVPGVEENNEKFQGVDRLVDVMLGDEFGVMIIAKPVGADDIRMIEKNLYTLYSGLAPFSKRSTQDSKSKNIGTSVSTTKSTNDTTGETYSSAVQTGTGTSNSTTIGKSYTETKGTSKGTTISTSTGASSSSKTEGGNEGTNNTKATGTSESQTTGTSTNKGNTETKGTSNSHSLGESITEGKNTGEGETSSVTVEFINKEVQDWITYLDEVLFKRLDYGKGKGVFVTSTVLFSKNKGSLIKLENTVKSLYSGETGNKVPLKRMDISNSSYNSCAFHNFQIPKAKLKTSISTNEISARSAFSQFIKKDFAYMGNWFSTNELSLIAGLPQKEIVGLALREEVDFGLNFNTNVEEDRQIKLGNLVQSGQVLNNIEVYLDKQHLNKHTFITGVTGSGKTTTCQKILMDSELPFLVIEPAKTEYRILTQHYNDLLVFTLGKDTVSPFRLNPFEFFPHESITSRVDMIKASIEASFDMEAAIPQIIETAIYACYEDYGWNIARNRNTKYEDPFADGVYAFPTLSDLIEKTEQVVEKQGFDERLKKDYIGSIKARLQGLTVGAKGLMLDTRRSVDFRDLIHQKVVLELEEIRSGTEKSLIMGFILTNLMEAIKAEYLHTGTEFKHITLIEEAHRLLSKYTPGDSLNKKQSVETFADMLAEVRKYGESLIIVDQIPGKLTPEVLKNTNTKIVHKIFAQDDKEAIGNTMTLTDEQKEFLSKLSTGRAIVFTQDWPKALQVQVLKTTNTTGEKPIEENVLRRAVLSYYCKTYKRGIFRGIEMLEKEPSVDELESFISDDIFNYYACFLKKLEVEFEFKKLIEQLVERHGIRTVARFICKGYYDLNKCDLEEKQQIVETLVKDIIDSNRIDKIKYYNNLYN